MKTLLIFTALLFSCFVCAQSKLTVKLAQKALTEKGYNLGDIDGDFGKKTKKAVLDFQKKNNLSNQNGMLNTETLNALGLDNKTPLNSDGYILLSWEVKDERADWSKIVYGKINALWGKFQKCTDITDFRPDYNSLTESQQKSIWAELICAMCKFESDWIPTNAMVEKSMGIDKITNKQVRSEGLMQLSYQDTKNYKFPCEINWEKDKNLADNDPDKTIFNPKYNLEFGIEILANQIEKHGKIVLNEGVYWAIIKKNGKYNKVLQITKIIEEVVF